MPKRIPPFPNAKYKCDIIYWNSTDSRDELRKGMSNTNCTINRSELRK
jgi:hypothetical protein